jgi:hemerythrin
MAFFDWKDSYSVGVAEMDQQHKKLIDLINKLYEAMKVGKAANELDSVIGEMVTYTKFHFGAEEKLMTTHGYPGLLAQKGEHKIFTEKAMEFQQQIQSGKKTISIEVMNFLKDWLTKHILGNDQKYTKFFNDKGVK